MNPKETLDNLIAAINETLPPHTIDTRRALTVHAPWAWAIVAGLKTVENRKQPIRYRGRLYIHVGLKESEAASAWMQSYLAHHAPGFADNPGWALRGGIIGHVDVIGCDVDSTADPFEIPGHYFWRLANPTIIPYERCRGAQGMWRIGDQKKYIELPQGFTVKTSKTGTDEFTAKLYEGPNFVGAFTGGERIESIRAATGLALQIHALPKISFESTCPCCE